MKSVFIIISIFLISQIAFSQNWKNINYNDFVTFQLPDGYTKKDTLGASIFQSEINDTTYICTFMPDPEPLRFESNESIDAFYNDYFDNLVAKSDKPKIISKDIIEFGKFRAIRARLERNVIIKELTWEILTIHVKNITCSFQCLTQKRAKAQFARVEKSIQFNEKLTREDQISKPVILSQALTTNQYLQYGLFALVGLIVIYIFGKRVFFKRKEESK